MQSGNIPPLSGSGLDKPAPPVYTNEQYTMKERKDENGQTVYFREPTKLHDVVVWEEEAAGIPDYVWQRALFNNQPGPIQCPSVVPVSVAPGSLAAEINPQHYFNKRGIELIDVIEDMPFNLGCAMKYLFRCDTKDTPESNINKALWYIRRELKRRNLTEIQ